MFISNQKHHRFSILSSVGYGFLFSFFFGLWMCATYMGVSFALSV
ncbi:MULTISPECIES: hypothetical protein [Peptoniphilus]|nr:MULTISPECIES: hypothetical protein [Peptoniphilus]